MIRDRAARVDRLLGTAERRLRDAFLLSVARVRSQASLRRVAALLASGRAEEALRLVDQAGERLARAWGREHARSARSAARFLGLSGVDLGGRAGRRVEAHLARVVREFASSQRRATSEVLARGAAAGKSPRQLTRDFRASLGLSPQQAQASASYRLALEAGSVQALTRELRDRRFDATVRRGDPLTPAQVDRMVERYEERLLARRAAVIAGTEALRSVHEGAEEATLQLMEGGGASPAQVQQVWHTQGDHRVRDSHSPMSGQVRPWGIPFRSGNGNLLRHPGDLDAPASDSVNCRCFLTTSLLSPAEVALVS